MGSRRDRVNAQYYVEFDLPEIFRWRENVVETEQRAFSFTQKGQKILIIGQVEAVFDNDSADIRLGTSIITLDM